MIHLKKGSAGQQLTFPFAKSMLYSSTSLFPYLKLQDLEKTVSWCPGEPLPPRDQQVDGVKDLLQNKVWLVCVCVCGLICPLHNISYKWKFNQSNF